MHATGEEPRPAPVRRAAFAFVFVTVALDMLALGVIVPVLPKLVLEFEGGDSATAAEIYGAFGTVFAAMQFLFAPVLGAVSDRFGRRSVILLSNVGLALDYTLMALAPSVRWLFVGRAIGGICAASFTTAMAYIADVTPPEQRAARFGMLNASFGLGFVVGPAFGGLLGSVDPRLPFWVAAALTFANAIYGLFVLPESLPASARAPFAWRRANPVGALLFLREHGHLVGLAAVLFLHRVAHEALPSTFVLYADHRYGWDTFTVGMALALLGVSSASVQALLVGPVVQRLGERWSLLVGLAFGVAAFLLLGLAPTGGVFAVGMPLITLWGFASPAVQSLMTRQVDATGQGRLQGALAGLQGVAGMIGPVLFTTVFAGAIAREASLYLPGAPMLLAASLTFAALAVAALVARPPGRL
jgi:DHA1 family tetracycline resistance protein-like MFS transporter